MRLTSSQKMATHSSILAWKIPRTEEPDGLYSPWGCKTDMTERTHMGTHTRGAVEEIRKGFWEVETEQHLRGQGGSGYAGLEEKCSGRASNMRTCPRGHTERKAAGKVSSTAKIIPVPHTAPFLSWVKHPLSLVRVHSVAQWCLTLCDSMDSTLPGSSVCGISQARIVEWVAMPSSRGSSPPKDQTHIPCISCISTDSLSLRPLGCPIFLRVLCYVISWRAGGK